MSVAQRRVVAVALPLLVAGCLRQGFERQGTPAPLDATSPRDVATPGEAVAPGDSGHGASLDASHDAPPADAAASPCADFVETTTLLLLTFEGSDATASDLTGAHHGTLVGNKLSRIPSRAGCGMALAFPGGSDFATTDSYVEVADDQAWDLDEGSVDFWVRIDSLGTHFRGLVSRDAAQTTLPGHLSVLQLLDGGLAVRLQSPSATGVSCSAPLSLGAWHHVGINFGPQGLELFVDGLTASRQGLAPSATGWTLQCGTPATFGIAGNANPWVLGGATNDSAEGEALPVSLPFHGALDSVRVSGARRPFGGQ